MPETEWTPRYLASHQILQLHRHLTLQGTTAVSRKKLSYLAVRRRVQVPSWRPQPQTTTNGMVMIRTAAFLATVIGTPPLDVLGRLLCLRS